MWEKIMEAGTGVHILWGVALFGVLLKIIISVYLNGIVKASQDMSTTRKKSLMAIRQKLENRRSLAMDMGSGEAFVNKNVYNIRCMGIPINSFSRMGSKLCLVVFMATAGAFLYYDVSWRGSPDMIYFMANAVFVCAFLMLLENIFLVTNKLELLKANIWDYFETVKGGRMEQQKRCNEHENIRRAENKDASLEIAASDMVVPDEETEAHNEEILNSFLKEFFT